MVYNRGMAKARIAINGFGRIGRLFFKAAFESPDLEVVAINDLGDVENLAYLLKYDTVYGHYDKEVRADLPNGKLVVGGAAGGNGEEDETAINFLQIKDATQLPWKAMNIDIVVESTGIFESYAEKQRCILAAGAKRVVITAPAKDEDGAGRKNGFDGSERERYENLRHHVKRFVHDEFGVARDSGAFGKSGHREGDALHRPFVHRDAEHCGRAGPRRQGLPPWPRRGSRIFLHPRRAPR